MWKLYHNHSICQDFSLSIYQRRHMRTCSIVVRSQKNPARWKPWPDLYAQVGECVLGRSAHRSHERFPEPEIGSELLPLPYRLGSIANGGLGCGDWV